MTQEEKQFVYKDLCARLPYKLLGLYYLECKPLEPIGFSELTYELLHRFINADKLFYLERIVQIKPYLRPMSSMTQEELNKLEDVASLSLYDSRDSKVLSGKTITNGADVDWLIANHFDYRNLIEKGLALEAPNGMYDFK